MAKLPTKVLKGIPITGNYAMEDGKLVGKPSRKTSVSQKIAKRKKPSQKYTRTQKP